MRRVKEDRSMLLYILLSAVTCGIYAIYFWWKVMDDLGEMYIGAGMRKRGTPHFIVWLILYVLTCGSYMHYWYYCQGNQMQECGKRYGIEIKENGIFYLVLGVLGIFTFGMLGCVRTFIMIDNLNELATAHNTRVGAGAAPAAPDITDGIQKKGKAMADKMRGAAGRFGENVKKNPQSQPNPGFADNSATMAVKAGQIIGQNGMYAGVSIDIKDGDSILIGRDGTMSNLVVEDNAVSRRHCRIRFSSVDQMYFVTDLSTNGTFLGNGRKLEKDREVAVTAGTKIILGQSQQTFLLK
ncbi:MAG: DUF4234 domain-containing protein [Enterocloster sp.]